MRLPMCLTSDLCLCYEGRHTSRVCHAKRHESSELSRELKDPEYADKDKTPGVCIYAM